MSKTIYIGGRLESKEKGNVVTGANAILDDTKGKKQNVINKETDDELLRLEQSKQDNLNFDNTPTEDSTNPVTSGGVYTAEKALSDAIEAILLLIPSAATALNKLVDTNTMNSSISTATATFRGTYNAVSDLGLTYQATHAQIEAALDALGLTADNNDFAFVQIPVSDQSQDIAKTERFKFNGTNWLYEYDLNTSGFTVAQWAAINSGITVALVTKLTDLPTATALQLALNTKQDTLTFDNEPTALSQNPVTSGGIYTAIQAVATALSDYSTTTDGRLDVLEGLIPTEASSSNKLTDKAYVDGLIQAITELIPAEADTTNQLADKAYVLAQILAATPAFKGQYVTLAELQAVASPKAGDLGIVRTKDSDGMDVFTVYQYLNNAWNVFFSLGYHPQTKPATTGTTGDYPYNGMGRVELAKNMVNTGTDLEPVMLNQLTQDMFYKGAAGSRVPNTNTIFVIRYDYVLAENITIPDGCVLEFEGGSISGAYTITGNGTYIEGTKDIFNDVIIAGTWKNKEVSISWFSNNTDLALTNAINIGKIINVDKDIALSQNIAISKSGITIRSEHKTITNGVYSIGFSQIRDVNIEGVNFLGTIDNTATQANILGFSEVTNCHVKDCVVDGAFYYGILFIQSTQCSVDGCTFKESYNTASQMLCSGRACNYFYVRNNHFVHIGYVFTIRLDACSYSYVENNTLIDVKNNPIFINSNCSYCNVVGNYISTSLDSGIILANDSIEVPDGEGGTMVATDLPHDVIIRGNQVYDCSDAGIAVYPSSPTGSIARNIIIENNILSNNGVRQTSSIKFKSGILVEKAGNVAIVDNLIDVETDCYGIYVGENIAQSNDATVYYDGYNFIIKGNSANARIFGTTVGNTNGQVVSLKTDIGFPVIQDFNLYTNGGDGYPQSVAGVFTWGQNPGDFAVACDFSNIDKKIIGVHNAASPAANASLCLTFNDLSLFARNCIFTIRGLIKVSDAACNGRIRIIQNSQSTSSHIRLSSPYESGTTWVPFEVSGLYCAGNVQNLMVLFEGTNVNQWTYFKDVQFEIRYL